MAGTSVVARVLTSCSSAMVSDVAVQTLQAGVQTIDRVSRGWGDSDACGQLRGNEVERGCQQWDGGAKC